MKLIKDLGIRRINNKQTVRYGLFCCEYCNNEIEKRISNGLKQKSCGCMRGKFVSKARTKHGDSIKDNVNRLFSIWSSMKGRCYSLNAENYKYYGGRGIKVCEEWKNDYLAFKTWASDTGYKDNLSIDRIENDGNYEPSNCKWSTSAEQARNRRNNKLTLKKTKQIRSIYFNIKIKQMLLAKIFNVSYNTINNIINYKNWIE